MHRGTRIFSLLLAGLFLASATLLAQRASVRGGPPTAGAAFVPAPGGYTGSTPVFPTFPEYPQFSSYGFRQIGPRPLDPSWIAPSYPPDPAPSSWWARPYPMGDAPQVGYNPDAGYPWDSVGALVLNTFPLKAQVILDGTCVGTADKLGPFQLPVGAYTLRVEAVGYQPSETVVKFDVPGVRQLDIKLKPSTVAANAAKRN